MRKLTFLTMSIAYGSFLVLVVANHADGDNAERLEKAAGYVFTVFTLGSLLLVGAMSYRAFLHKSPSWPLSFYASTVFLALLCFGLQGYLDSRVARTRSDTLDVMRELEVEIHGYARNSGSLPDRLSDVVQGDSLLDPFSRNHKSLRWIVLSPSRSLLVSVGPDHEYDVSQQGDGTIYDSSNGTVSRGDIVRTIALGPPGAPDGE